MKIGVMIEGQEGLTWEHWFKVADRVESLGLDSLWRSDHFFSLSGDLQRPALEPRDGRSQMLGVGLQIVAFLGVCLPDIVVAIEQRVPEARFGLLFAGLEPAADLVEEPHRAVQFGDFRFAQREVGPHVPRRPDLPDVAENEPGQHHPQREQDRVDESSRKLSAAFRG